MDLPSRLDLYAIGRNYLRTRAKRIDPGQVDVLGSDANLFVGSQSVVSYAIVKQLAYRTAALMLDSAYGEDLDRYAWDRYQLTRKGASAALGAVRFYRTSFAAGGGSIPIGTTVGTVGGITYTTTSVATFGASQLDNATANVRASQAGKATQVGANVLVKFSNIAALFDPSIQVNNDAKTAGGEDPEDDETFRNRIRGFWLTARRGVLSAIAYGATQVPGVVSAQAVEALNGIGQPARIVNLYIADSSGVASAQLANLVAISLGDYRAGGIAVVIYPSMPTMVPIVLDLTFLAGTDTIALTQTIVAAIVEFVNSLQVNAPLYIADLLGVLRRYVSSGLVQNQSSIVSPAGDLVPPLGQSFRTTTALVSDMPTAVAA